MISKGTGFTLAPVVEEAVAGAAIETGQARAEVDPATVAAKVRCFIFES